MFNDLAKCGWLFDGFSSHGQLAVEFISEKGRQVQVKSCVSAILCNLGRFIRHVSTICAQIFAWHSDHVRIETLLNESVIAVIRFSTTFNACARKPFLPGRVG